MNARYPDLSRVVLRVLQLSAVIAVLSLLVGLGIGWITHRLVFGATFGTLCFFSGLMGFMPFRQNIRDIAVQTWRIRALILVEASILVAIVYFISMVTMRSMDNAGFIWLSNPRQPYILAPACFYGVVLIAMAISFVISANKWLRG